MITHHHLFIFEVLIRQILHKLDGHYDGFGQLCLEV